MACVNEKGQLPESAIKLLKSIENDALTAQDISKHTGIPLFKVRSGLREMKSLEFVIEENEKFKIHPNANKFINS